MMEEERDFLRRVLAEGLLPGFGLREGETVEERLAQAEALDAMPWPPDGIEPPDESETRWRHTLEYQVVAALACLIPPGEGRMAADWRRMMRNAGEADEVFALKGRVGWFWNFWIAQFARAFRELTSALLDAATGNRTYGPRGRREVFAHDWYWQAVRDAGIDFGGMENCFPWIAGLYERIGGGKVRMADACNWMEQLGDLRERWGRTVGAARMRQWMAGEQAAQAPAESRAREWKLMGRAFEVFRTVKGSKRTLKATAKRLDIDPDTAAADFAWMEREWRRLLEHLTGKALPSALLSPKRGRPRKNWPKMPKRVTVSLDAPGAAERAALAAADTAKESIDALDVQGDGGGDGVDGQPPERDDGGAFLTMEEPSPAPAAPGAWFDCIPVRALERWGGPDWKARLTDPDGAAREAAARDLAAWMREHPAAMD